MKKKKQFLALLLALLLLTGCAVRPGGTEPLESGQTDSTGIKLPTIPSHPMPTEPEPVVSRQLLPATVDNPENLPVIKWVNLCDYIGGSNRTWTEDAVIEFNSMLSDRKLPFRVQLVMYTFDTIVTEPGYFFDRPEVQEDLQTADIIFGEITGADAKNYLMPITEYVKGNAEPSLKNAVPHEDYWNFVSLDGEIYGIPTRKQYPSALSWYVDKSYMQELGLTDADFQKNYWEMDEIFAKIYEKKGGFLVSNGGYAKFTYSAGLAETSVAAILPGAQFADYQMKEYFNLCGSIFAIDEKTDQVVNMMDTEFTRNLQQSMARYLKAFYTTKGTYKVSQSGGHTYIASSMADGSSNRIIPVGSLKYIANERIAPVHMNGITKDSQYKEESLTLLKLLAEDEELLIQFAYGKEGRDYTIDEDGYYHMVKHEDGSNYSLSHLAVMSGFLESIIGKGGGDTINPGAYSGKDIVIEGMSRLETHREVWNKAEKRYVVFFDYSGFEEELAAIEKICKSKFGSFDTMTPEKYDQMIADFNAAGADRILASLQKQYDQWKKDNPDKV